MPDLSGNESTRRNAFRKLLEIVRDVMPTPVLTCDSIRPYLGKYLRHEFIPPRDRVGLGIEELLLEGVPKGSRLNGDDFTVLKLFTVHQVYWLARDLLKASGFIPWPGKDDTGGSVEEEITFLIDFQTWIENFWRTAEDLERRHGQDWKAVYEDLSLLKERGLPSLGRLLVSAAWRSGWGRAKSDKYRRHDILTDVLHSIIAYEPAEIFYRNHDGTWRVNQDAVEDFLQSAPVRNGLGPLAIRREKIHDRTPDGYIDLDGGHRTIRRRVLSLDAPGPDGVPFHPQSEVEVPESTESPDADLQRWAFEYAMQTEEDRDALNALLEWIDVREKETVEDVARRRGLPAMKVWRCKERLSRRARTRFEQSRTG